MTRIQPADLTDTSAPSSGNAKLQRWVDLLAALLSRNSPVTFEQLAVDVPEYHLKLRAIEKGADPIVQERDKQSLKRAFERDKAELRQFGITIESLEDADGNEGGAYRLRRKDFYLPYLAFTSSAGKKTDAKTVDKFGYRELAKLSFDADELQAVVDAALMLRNLGEPMLTAHAEHALRKLAFDLPVGQAEASRADPHFVQPRAKAARGVFEALSDALQRKKTVTFDYHNFSRGSSEQRVVNPYGLFFLHGHWYLAGFDRARGDLRNFRLSRIPSVSVNAKKKANADYDIPPDFRLREHAASRNAWELGDEDPVTVTVHFNGTSGPTLAARALSHTAGDDDSLRTYPVRRMDTFIRWLLSLAGEATPVHPPEAVNQYRAVIDALAEMYAKPATPAEPQARTIDSGNAKPETWQPVGAAAQLRRLLQVIPQVADGEDHDLEQLAQSTGVDLETLKSDMYSLVTRFDLPGGFVEGVQVMIESNRVSAVSNHLMRPMRLTTPELNALVLGLTMLRNHRAPNEHALLERARERIRALLVNMPADSIHDSVHSASMASHVESEILAAVQEGITTCRQLRITYHKSGSDGPSERTVCGYALVASSGMLYLLAGERQDEGLRLFRLDRIGSAVVLADAFDVPDDVSPDGVLEEHRALLRGEHRTMIVRYSPRIASWIAEREGAQLASDGSLVLEHPVADTEWAIRHVLQYGTDAEVVGPEGVREVVAGRLTAIRPKVQSN